jgi:hypothetical protein
MTAPPTLVTPDYLRKIQNALLELQDQVEAQLHPTGTFTDGNGDTRYVPPVNPNLKVDAGGPAGNSGSFEAASDLNTQLGACAGSIQEQLLNWQKWCSDMISDINTTLANFGNVNDLNTQTVQQLLNDFPLTFADLSSSGNGGSPG